VATGDLPSSTERAAFLARLRRDAPLDDGDLAALEADVRVRQLPAGTTFLRCGEVAVDCGAVLRGLVREYYPLEDGREVTRAFAGPGDYIGSLSDLLSGQPALSSLVAEADTVVVVVPWRRIRELAARRPAWAEFVALVVERVYLAKAAREYELLALDAEARYRRFRTLYAALEPAIALRHVASYVGITPEHLSRVRRRLGIAAPRSPARSPPGTRSSGPDSPGGSRPARRRARRPAPVFQK
jgi:CRP-like cAMP-binding protein